MKIKDIILEGGTGGFNVVAWYRRNGGNQIKMTKWLKDAAGLSKDAPVYFDDADLVYGDKTIVSGALVNDSLTVNDLLNAVKNAASGTNLTELDNGPNGTYNDNVNVARRRQDPAKADYSGYGAQAKSNRAAQSAANANARREKQRARRAEDRLLGSIDEQDVMSAIRRSDLGVGDPDHFVSYRTTTVRIGGKAVAAVKCSVYTSIDPTDHLGYEEGGEALEEIIDYTVYRDPARPNRLVTVQGHVGNMQESTDPDDLDDENVHWHPGFSREIKSQPEFYEKDNDTYDNGRYEIDEGTEYCPTCEQTTSHTGSVCDTCGMEADDDGYYEEPVGRYKVMKQLNDPERNPEGAWSLIYSTSDPADAEEVAEEQRQRYKKFGDVVKVVDGGKATSIRRPAY